MTTTTTPCPPIVSRDQWLAERKKLLVDEKELTRQYDRVNAARRRLPMVKIEKDYAFEGPNGKENLASLFEGRRQLIVYHFMFDPAWDKGCSGCTGFVDALGDLSLLNETRHHVRGYLARSAGQARGLQKAKEMEHRLVFLVRQRFQLRLSRDARSEYRAGRIQLSEQGRDGGSDGPPCQDGG